MMLRLLIIITAILAIFFMMFPNIDLRVSELFYDTQKGGFWLKNNLILLAFYYLVKYSRYILPVFFGMILMLNFARGRKFLFGNREIIFLSLALLIGPVLITGIFKDNWHRARPAQTAEFGGDHQFTRAFVISDDCPENCYSFVSGHAAMGCYFTAFALVLAGSARKKRLAYLSLLALGILISFARVMQGQHYLSDVIFGGIFSLIAVHAAYLFVFSSKFLDLIRSLKKIIRQKNN